MWPLAWLSIPKTVARPSPVPAPLALVVKNGSKACSATSGGIPVPVSLTRSRDVAPLVGAGDPPATELASTVTFPVSMVTVPPPGMASRALTARLTSTCSRRPGSASTGHSPSASEVTSWDILADGPPQHFLYPGDYAR